MSTTATTTRMHASNRASTRLPSRASRTGGVGVRRLSGRNPLRAASSSVARAASADEKKALSDAEYVALKAELTSTTMTHAGALSAYCLLGYGVAPGLSAALGGVGALGYLKLLQEYVDTVSEEESSGNISESDYTRNLVYEPVTDVGAMLGGAFGKVGGVYSRALLQKRLLVPAGLVAFTSAWNHLDLPFDFSYGATFCGFLCYKTAVLAKTWDILKPLLLAEREE